MAISEFKLGNSLRLGPEQHTFNDVDQASTEADRDTYFSANPSKLAVYDGNSNLMIRLVYLDGPDEVTRFQSRLAGSWADVTPVVQGPSGSVASLAGVPVGEIPYKTISGDFAGSNMRVLEDGRVLAPPGFTVESGSVTFGEAITLSEISGFLGISNHLNDREYTVVDFYTPSDDESAPPSIFHLIEPAFEFVAQAVDTTNIPDNPLDFEYTVQNTARSRAIKLRTYAPMTNVRLKISQVSNGVVLKYIPSQQVWEEEFGGLSWVLGDNTYEFGDTSLNLNAGTELHFELRADTVSLKGNALGIPYFTAMLQRGEFRDVITDAVYTDEDVRDKLTGLVGVDRLSGTALKENVTSVNSMIGDVTITKSTVGLSNVDNTSDVNKPVSTAQSAAIAASMAAHNAAGDPHPQYTTTAEASAAAPVQSVNLLTGNVVLTTTNIAEGGNLYYSDSRVQSYITASGYTVKSASSIGSGNAVYKQNVSGALEFRSIIATGGVSAVQNANDITLTVTTLNSSTYTPTLSNVANITSSASFQAQWMRVGNIVTVSGKVTIDPALPNQDTILGISLPVASNFGAQEDLAGTAATPTVAGQSAGVYADTAADTAILQYVAGTVASHSFFYTYTYEVL